MSRASVSAVIALAAASAAAVLPAQAQGSADRYGPSSQSYASPSAVMSPPAGAPASSAAPAFRGRMLSWPGKLDTVAVAPPAYAPPREGSNDRQLPAPGRYAAPYYAPAADGPARYSRAATGQGYADPEARRPARYAPARYRGPAAGDGASPVAGATQDGWRPVFAGGAPSRVAALSPPAELAGAPATRWPARAPLPTSIYAPAAAPGPRSDAVWSPGARAAAAPPPVRSASAAQRYGYDATQDHGVRFYSVHRPFGLQPDRPPIPPQFFTATADLGDPPGPLPTDHSTTTSTGTTHTNRVVSDTSAN